MSGSPEESLVQSYDLQALGVNHPIVAKRIEVTEPREFAVLATFIETPRRFVVGPAARLDDQESCFPFVETPLDFVEETRTAAFTLMIGDRLSLS